MGFHPAWKYENVVELVFENGMRAGEFNRSDRMAEIREMVVNSDNESSGSTPTEDEIRQFVERAFDRTYRL